METVIATNAHDISLECGRLRVVLATIVINVAPGDAWLVDYPHTLDYSIGGGPMIWPSPWYIILGEFGIALVLALLARTLRCGSWHVAVVAGIAGGA
jgi:hypothetical protein